jgi:hypothetical protein
MNIMSALDFPSVVIDVIKDKDTPERVVLVTLEGIEIVSFPIYQDFESAYGLAIHVSRFLSGKSDVRIAITKNAECERCIKKAQHTLFDWWDEKTTTDKELRAAQKARQAIITALKDKE